MHYVEVDAFFVESGLGRRALRFPFAGMRSLRNFHRPLLRFLKGRFFRNLLFWAYVFYNVFGNTAPEHKVPARAYYAFVALTTAILIALTYTNNLWLVPRFLARRRYWLYVPSVLALTILAALAYTLAIKASLSHFPVLEIQQPAMIHSPVTDDWSLAGMLADTESYWGGMMIWTAFFTLAWYMNDYVRQARAAREARERQTELEHAALKSQLHPHFLFNTLNNLYGLASARSEQAPGAILQLSGLLRYLLYESSASLVPFRAEAGAIHAYADLERLRLEDSAVLEIHTEGSDQLKLPPLLWLPVLENAFKHGTRFIGAPYVIRFRMEVAEGSLLMECRNRYKPGTPSGEAESEQGIGLANLRKRLQILFPSGYELRTEADGEWFHFFLTAPLPVA